jgi:hypothetical protein
MWPQVGDTWRAVFWWAKLLSKEHLKDKIVILNSYPNSKQNATVYQNLLFNVYMKLNMFQATHRPSSGAQNYTGSLWVCIHERLLDVEVAGRLSEGVQQLQRPTTFLVCKLRGC